MRLLLVVALLTVAWAGGGRAQATAHSPDERASSVLLRVGAAGGLAWTTVGGETSNEGGVLLTGLFGIPVSGRSALALDIAVQPFDAHNPVRDEAFTAVYALAGLEVGLGQSRKAFFRPELGMVFREWSGADVWQPSETSVAIGLVLGYSLWTGRNSAWVFEVGARLSGAEELTSLLGSVGLSYTFIGARR